MLRLLVPGSGLTPEPRVELWELLWEGKGPGHLEGTQDLAVPWMAAVTCVCLVFPSWGHLCRDQPGIVSPSPSKLTVVTNHSHIAHLRLFLSGTALNKGP